MTVTHRTAGRRNRTDDLRINSPSLDRWANLVINGDSDLGFWSLCIGENDIVFQEDLLSHEISLPYTMGGRCKELQLICSIGHTRKKKDAALKERRANRDRELFRMASIHTCFQRCFEFQPSIIAADSSAPFLLRVCSCLLNWGEVGNVRGRTV